MRLTYLVGGCVRQATPVDEYSDRPPGAATAGERLSTRRSVLVGCDGVRALALTQHRLLTWKT